MSERTADAERACQISLIASVLAIAGLGANALGYWSIVRPSSIVVVAMAVCAVVAAFLLGHRRHPSSVHANATFLIVNAAVIVSNWVNTQQLAETGSYWVPFRPHQLGVIAVALLAPTTWWVGAVTIAGFVTAALIQFVLFEPVLKQHLAHGSVLATCGFGGFAIAIYLFRLRSSRVERMNARAQMEAETYERLARAMLALRDLANTPLQTIANSIELLRRRDPALGTIADRLERAVHRLRELEEVARPYERQLPARPGDEALDAPLILRTLSGATRAR